jgi:proteasome lid subunit RPN8/RPN11
MRIRHSEIEALEAHAREGYPFEVCGALLAPRAAANGLTVTRAVRLENREAESPRVRYAIAPEDLLRLCHEAAASGLEVVGYYHSHPDHPAQPSETDRQRAAESISDGVIHVVVGVVGGEAATSTAWVFRDSGGVFEPEPIQVCD